MNGPRRLPRVSAAQIHHTRSLSLCSSHAMLFFNCRRRRRPRYRLGIIHALSRRRLLSVMALSVRAIKAVDRADAGRAFQNEAPTVTAWHAYLKPASTSDRPSRGRVGERHQRTMASNLSGLGGVYRRLSS